MPICTSYKVDPMFRLTAGGKCCTCFLESPTHTTGLGSLSAKSHLPVIRRCLYHSVAHQATIALHIGAEDGRQLAFHTPAFPAAIILPVGGVCQRVWEENLGAEDAAVWSSASAILALVSVRGANLPMRNRAGPFRGRLRNGQTIGVACQTICHLSRLRERSRSQPRVRGLARNS